MSLSSTRALHLMAGALTALLMTAPPARACSVALADVDGNGTLDLRLTATTGKQNVILDLQTSGYRIQVDCNGNGTYGNAGDIDQTGPETLETYLLALGGNDTLTLLQAEDLVGASKSVVVSFTSGNNLVSFLAQGYATRDASNLVFDVRGGGGADSLTVDFSGGTIDSSLVSVLGDLGTGANSARFVGATETLSSVVEVDLFLGTGKGNPKGTYDDGGGLVASSTVNVRMRGSELSTGVDTVSTTLRGRVEDRSRVYLSANLRPGHDKYLGHLDVSTFSMDAGDPSTSEVYTFVKGGEGMDTLTLDDNGAVGTALVDGTFVVDFDSGAQIDTLGIDLAGLGGAGQFRYRADGGSQRDKVNGAVSVDGAATASLWFYFGGFLEEDFSVNVADTVTVAFDAPASVDWGPLGAVVLDGGIEGGDTCNFTGTAPVVAYNCEKGRW